MKERDCANCKHHTSNGCSSWDCEFESTDLISRADAIDACCRGWNNTVEDCIRNIREIPSAWYRGMECAQDIISALPSAELTLQTPQTYGKSINPSNAEVVEDLISRADAKQQISEWATIITKPTLLDKDATMVVLDLLPSTEAVQGEWVCKEREYNDCDGHYAHYWYECSVCGARPPKDQWKNEWHSNFCPSCGARMVKGGDTE